MVKANHPSPTALVGNNDMFLGLCVCFGLCYIMTSRVNILITMDRQWSLQQSSMQCHPEVRLGFSCHIGTSLCCNILVCTISIAVPIPSLLNSSQFQFISSLWPSDKWILVCLREPQAQRTQVALVLYRCSFMRLLQVCIILPGNLVSFWLRD